MAGGLNCPFCLRETWPSQPLWNKPAMGATAPQPFSGNGVCAAHKP